MLSVPGPHHLAADFPFSCGSQLLSVSPALLSCRIHPGSGCSACCAAGQMCWGISISFLPGQPHCVIEGNRCLNSSAPSPLWWENPKICFTQTPRVFPAGLGSTLHGGNPCDTEAFILVVFPSLSHFLIPLLRFSLPPK